LEDTLKAFMQIIGQAIAKMEVQMGQMANHLSEREKGKLPSQPIPNPKLQFDGGSSSNPTHGQEHVQVIVTLRSRRWVDNQVVLPEENLAMPQRQDSGNKEERDAEPNKATIIVKDPLIFFIPKAPYPDRLQVPKKGGKFEDILEVFKQVQINILFLDATQKVPSYAKFLKDFITVKRRTNVPKKVCLTEQVSSILQCKLPIKYKDPRCPTISCMIGVNQKEKAWLDLGARVNLLPYSVYLQLGLGELKPTSMTLQFTDKSVKVPRGIIEDILIKFDKFYFLMDFIMLDTKPVQNVGIQIPVILGRPFLAMANAIIIVEWG